MLSLKRDESLLHKYSLSQTIQNSRPLLTVLFAGTLLASPCMADITYADFSSIDGLTLNGSASQVGNVLRLTPDLQSQLGTAWYTEQQSVENGFTSSFQFQITHSGGLADGFWFFVQNHSLTDFPAAYFGMPNAFSVEFDTFENVWDPNGNHVAFQSCGTNPHTTRHDTGCTLGINSVLPVVLADGVIHTGLVKYAPGVMELWLDGSMALTAPVDLSSLLQLNDGKAWVGFGTSTGALSENNDILSWQYTAVPEPGSIWLLGCALGAVVMLRRRTLGKSK